MRIRYTSKLIMTFIFILMGPISVLKADENETPSAVLKSFYTLIYTGEVANAYDLISDSVKPKFEEHGGSTYLLNITEAMIKKGLKDIKIIDENITDSRAVVTFDFVGAKRSRAMTETLVQESGRWKIEPSFTPRAPRTTGRTTKPSINEVMILSSMAKTSITEYFQTTGVLPPRAMNAGVNTASSQSKYLKDISYSIKGNSVQLAYTFGKPEMFNGRQFILSGTIDSESKRLTWSCKRSTIKKEELPKGCR